MDPIRPEVRAFGIVPEVVEIVVELEGVDPRHGSRLGQRDRICRVECADPG
jgi:hypothetical protein